MSINDQLKNQKNMGYDTNEVSLNNNYNYNHYINNYGPEQRGQQLANSKLWPKNNNNTEESEELEGPEPEPAPPQQQAPQLQQEIDDNDKKIIEEFGLYERDILFNTNYSNDDIDDMVSYIKTKDPDFFKNTFFNAEENTYKTYFNKIQEKLDAIITEDCDKGKFTDNKFTDIKICRLVNYSIKRLKEKFTYAEFEKYKNKTNKQNNQNNQNNQKINQNNQNNNNQNNNNQNNNNQNDNSFILDFTNNNNDGIKLSTIQINGTTFVVDKLFNKDVNLEKLALDIKNITLFNGKLTKFKNNKTNGGKTIKKHKKNRNRNKKITNKYNEQQRRIFTDEFLKIST
jgi:hypothetical protein